MGVSELSTPARELSILPPPNRKIGWEEASQYAGKKDVNDLIERYLPEYPDGRRQKDQPGRNDPDRGNLVSRQVHKPSFIRMKLLPQIKDSAIKMTQFMNF